jgi:thioredoxin 1
MSDVINTTNDNFQSDVLESNVPVLVDFWATWCAPCKAIAPVLEDLAAEYDGKAKVVKVDVTENQEIAARYGIRNIPALYLFKDGEVVDQVVGALPRSQLVNFVEKNL